MDNVMMYFLAIAACGHVKFLALSPCSTEPDDPLIVALSSGEMPDDPDDFTSNHNTAAPPEKISERKVPERLPERASQYPDRVWP